MKRDKQAARWQMQQLRKNRREKEIKQRIARELEEMDRMMAAQRSRLVSVFNPTHTVGIYHMECKSVTCPCKR